VRWICEVCLNNAEQSKGYVQYLLSKRKIFPFFVKNVNWIIESNFSVRIKNSVFLVNESIILHSYNKKVRVRLPQWIFVIVTVVAVL